MILMNYNAFTGFGACRVMHYVNSKTKDSLTPLGRLPYCREMRRGDKVIPMINDKQWLFLKPLGRYKNKCRGNNGRYGKIHRIAARSFERQFHIVTVIFILWAAMQVVHR